MRFVSGLFSGKLVDRFGERVVLGFGLFMVSVFTLLAGLAQSYEQLLIFQNGWRTRIIDVLRFSRRAYFARSFR